MNQALSIPFFTISKYPKIPSGQNFASVGNNFNILFLIIFEFPSKSFIMNSINCLYIWGINSVKILLMF